MLAVNDYWKVAHTVQEGAYYIIKILKSRDQKYLPRESIWITSGVNGR